MMKANIFIVLITGLFLLGSCTSNHIIPVENGDKTIPEKVKNIQVENLPGAARISYSLPHDASLLYVLARFTDREGKVREFKASHFTNSIVVDGFAKTGQQVVNLYSVSKGEVLSEPIQVTVEPLLPPYLATFNSMKMSEDFGGVNLVFDNESEADLGIFLVYEDKFGNFEARDSYYTNRKDGNYTFRGLPSEKKVFGIYIRDRWNNISDTMKTELTPLYEKMFDKKLFREVMLPGDAIEYTNLHNVAKRFMWNNNWSKDFNNPYGDYWNFTSNDQVKPDPIHSTFDMGVTGRVSRIRINHYYRFEHKALRKYEIWGATEPAPDGSWDGWTKLASFEQIKPSGLPAGQYTAADAEVWLQGDNMNIPLDMPKVRFIRLRSLENWIGNSNFSLAEITLWGDDRN